MGTPVEPDPTDQNCLTCWPDGGAPQFVIAAFSGLKAGDWWLPNIVPPPNHTFTLEQDAIFPCVYKYRGDVWEVTYQAVTIVPPFTRSALTLSNWKLGGFDAFGQINDEACDSGFVNALQVPAGQFWYSGAGWVFDLSV